MTAIVREVRTSLHGGMATRSPSLKGFNTVALLLLLVGHTATSLDTGGLQTKERLEMPMGTGPDVEDGICPLQRVVRV